MCAVCWYSYVCIGWSILNKCQKSSHETCQIHFEQWTCCCTACAINLFDILLLDMVHLTYLLLLLYSLYRLICLSTHVVLLYFFLLHVYKAKLSQSNRVNHGESVVVIRCMYVCICQPIWYTPMWRGAANVVQFYFSNSENIHFCTRALSKHSTNTQWQAFLPLPPYKPKRRRSSPMEPIVSVFGVVYV